MNDIFISYSRYDSDVVNELVSLLEQEGYSVWIDRVGIDNGDDFKRVILKAIKGSSIVLFFSSEHSNVSDWITKEIGIAVKYKKHIIPIKIDDSNFNEAVEFDLINLEYVDYSEKSTRLAMSERLLKTLRNKLGKGFGEIASKAKEQTEREWHEKERICEDLFADMIADIMKYKACVMNVLFGKMPSTEEMRNDDSPIGHFLNAGFTLTFEDIYKRGILPERNTIMEKAVFMDDFDVPQFTIDELGELPSGRTDVYFLGLPASGKTCLFTAVAKYFYDHGIVYEPLYNNKGIDTCYDYYRRCIDGVNSYKAPRSTGTETLSYLMFTTNDRRQKKLTIVESSGEAIKMVAETSFGSTDTWKRSGLERCLKNKNSKALFFLVDYSCINGRNREFSCARQEKFLFNILENLSSDGFGKYGERGCTMSMTKTIAVIITKCDLMDDEKERSLSAEERMEIANNYLYGRFGHFMNKISELCKKYGINGNNRNAYQPFVITFSIGRFYLGNSVVYDETDPARLANFLLNSV